jgi:hypothetical protein
MPKKAVKQMSHVTPGQRKIFAHGAVFKPPPGAIGSGIKIVIRPTKKR